MFIISKILVQCFLTNEKYSKQRDGDKTKAPLSKLWFPLTPSIPKRYDLLRIIEFCNFKTTHTQTCTPNPPAPSMEKLGVNIYIN